jgi:hypothetical protein
MLVGRIVARERSVLDCWLVVVEELKDPAGLRIGFLLGETAQAPLRVCQPPLGHEAGNIARN